MIAIHNLYVYNIFIDLQSMCL